MRNFQGTFETCRRSFVSASSVCMTVPLKYVKLQTKDCYRFNKTYVLGYSYDEINSN